VSAVSSDPAIASHPLGGRGLFIFWFLLALLWFLPLNSPHLFEPDEGRYAEIPREMVASGDWVTPRLDAIKYFEKPALQYWTTAAAYKLFGEHAWTVRLWPALTGFLGLLLTWSLARRIYDERAGLLAVMVQASALLYIAMARIATLDMSLGFTLQIAMTALALMVRLSTASNWRLPALLGVGVTLAVLTKGLVGILIPGATACLFMLIHRDWYLPLRARAWWTLGILVVVGAPWFVLTSQRNPEFAHFFFVVQHFQRYLSPQGFDRYQPWWFFIGILAAGFLPWTTFLPGALVTAVRSARAGDRASSFLVIWALFVLVFFSISQSKLAPYIVPLLPALSLLTGREIARLTPGRVSAHLSLIFLFALTVVLAMLVLWATPLGAALVARASTLSIAGFLVAFGALGICCARAAYLARAGAVISAVSVTSLGSLLLTQSALMGADYLPRMHRVVELEEHLRPALTPATHVYCVNEYLQPIPFYLQRPCTLVGYRGELDFGLTQEPWRFLPDLRSFATDWGEESDALAILRPEDYQQLETMGVPMRVIYTATSYVAVARE
jgi:4-amino-4-deoxy-L-arabinose transferase-like glycosyltransferase